MLQLELVNIAAGHSNTISSGFCSRGQNVTLVAYPFQEYFKRNSLDIDIKINIIVSTMKISIREKTIRRKLALLRKKQKQDEFVHQFVTIGYSTKHATRLYNEDYIWARWTELVRVNHRLPKAKDFHTEYVDRKSGLTYHCDGRITLTHS